MSEQRIPIPEHAPEFLDEDPDDEQQLNQGFRHAFDWMDESGPVE